MDRPPLTVLSVVVMLLAIEMAPVALVALEALEAQGEILQVAATLSSSI